MIFCQTNAKTAGRHPDLCINGGYLDVVYSTKCLGVILYYKLIWTADIQMIESKASKCIGILS